MKWVVFMNFWLEYMHETRKGEGHKMDEETPETLGQMMIDDSNCMVHLDSSTNDKYGEGLQQIRDIPRTKIQ